MTQTIYARVPEPVKEGADAYATDHGMTLANAVADLIDRGLQAAADQSSVADLVRRVGDLSAEVEVLRRRDQETASRYQALAQRTAQPVGSCVQCGQPVSGYDLLVTGTCPRDDCGASLTPLLSPRREPGSDTGSLNDGDFKLLLGALGLLLAIAFASQQGGGG